MTKEIDAMLGARHAQIMGDRRIPTPAAAVDAAHHYPEPSLGQSASSDPADGNGTGTTVVSFGKLRGLTFAEVELNHPDYVKWVLSVPEPSGKLQELAKYLNRDADEQLHASGNAPLR
jgi:hypothetical protein